MAAWIPVQGSTLLIPSGQVMHLFIVVGGPAVLSAFGYGNQDQLILVNVTSRHPNVPFDTACPLDVGDHPFINQPSYVAYRYARVDSLAHVTKLVGNGAWPSHQPLADPVLTRVVDGVQASRFAAGEIKRIMRGPP